MDSNIKLKEVGRINLEVERKLGINLSGDTNIYLSVRDQILYQQKFGNNYDQLLEKIRHFLKKPNFVRVSGVEEEFVYLTMIIRNGEIKPYELHVKNKEGKFYLNEFGFISQSKVAEYDVESKFVKIN